MTDKTKKPRIGADDRPYVAATPFKKANYTNEDGIQQVVLVKESETDLKTGIPLSLDLTELYGHMPIDFQRALTKALHDHGLIEPGDFFKAGAAERYQRAMRTVLKHDFLNIQALAKQELDYLKPLK